ncbi:MAG: maleylacetate reductase [Pseudomonadota bacterium]
MVEPLSESATETANPHEDAIVRTDTGVRVRFGAGLRHEIGSEIERLGCSRSLILSTPQQSQGALSLAEDAGELAAGVFTKAVMHTPVEVSEEAVAHARSVNADCVVAIGGGSTTGLGKAIALRTDLPQIVIPTTYAGSEATPILGQTENGLKVTLTDDKVLPEVILYDPELITSLPVEMTVTSALNAMAHAAEALYAQNRTPELTDMAVEGLQALISGLPEVIKDPDNLDARQQTMHGAWLCGTVLGRAGMALHHKLCHTLGGTFDLPHAATHAIILPHAIAYNEGAAADQLSPLKEMLGSKSAGQGLYEFAKRTGAPLALKDLGVSEADLDKAADLAVENAYWNPRPITRSGIRQVLQSAWEGQCPPE